MSAEQLEVENNKCSICMATGELSHTDLEGSKIEGELHFFFSVDMRKFLTYSVNSGSNDNRQEPKAISSPDFENWQGHHDFRDSLKELGKFDEFEKEDIESITEKIYLENDIDSFNKLGFNNGAFGAVLSDDWLSFPTSRIKEGKNLWLIRCSWMGIFEVHLIQPIEGENFVDVLDIILQSRSTTSDNDKDSIWNKVFDKIKQFCAEKSQELGKTGLRFHYPKNFLVSLPEESISFAERQRYVVVLARKITCNCKEPKRLSGELIIKNNLLPAMLSSSLVYDGGDKKIPDLNKTERVKNFSTWEDEICAFGSERGFIYYQFRGKVAEKNEHNYDQYWQYIIRGVQHTVTVRATLHMLQSQIKNLTDDLPELIANVDNNSDVSELHMLQSQIKNLTDDLPELIANVDNNSDVSDKLAKSLSNILQTMPKVNNICITTVAFKANYVVDKFKHLNNNCFNFPEVLRILRHDVADVSAFLQFAKSHQLRLAVENRRKEEGLKDGKRHIITTIAAFGAIVFVAPTAINDLSIFFSRNFHNSDDHAYRFIWLSSVVYLIIVGFAFLAYRIWKFWQGKSIADQQSIRD